MKRKRQNQKNQNLEDMLEVLVPFDNYFLKNHDAQAKLALKTFFEPENRRYRLVQCTYRRKNHTCF
ncbi:MAG: hypothetical protein LUF89_08860 [Ruminococcus sp.]|nr:hypothetical protein [Ruminococcus sp.]